MRVLGALLAVAAAVFVVREAVVQWPHLVDAVRDADGRWLVVSVALFVLAEVAFSFSWPVTLRALGHPVPMVAGASLFLVTQTAKFVPGSVWHLVGRAGAARSSLGIERRTTVASMAIEHGSSLWAALVLAGVTGAGSAALHGDRAIAPGVRVLEGAALVAVGIVAAVAGWLVARRAGGSFDGRGIAIVSCWHLAVWIGYGLAAAAMAAALGIGVLSALGAFTLSWACGLVVIGAPAGLGVREVVMQAALRGTASTSEAVALAIGTRAVWTIVQLGGAAVGLVILTRRGLRSRAAE